MTEEPEKGANLESEFKRLGENLKQSFQAAWESPSSQELQDEIKSGFQHLGETVDEVVTGIANSPSGLKLREEVDDFEQKLESGEVESKVRNELLNVLDTVNAELEKIRSKLGTADKDEEV